MAIGIDHHGRAMAEISCRGFDFLHILAYSHEIRRFAMAKAMWRDSSYAGLLDVIVHFSAQSRFGHGVVWIAG